MKKITREEVKEMLDGKKCVFAEFRTDMAWITEEKIDIAKVEFLKKDPRLWHIDHHNWLMCYTEKTDCYLADEDVVIFNISPSGIEWKHVYSPTEE